MNLTTTSEDYSALTSLVISPNLQALLEFDDRLRASSKTYNQPDTPSSSRVQHGRQPSWREQEVPTVSLPPPRRRKRSDVPSSPRTMSESGEVSSSAGAIPGAGEFGGSGEVVFTEPKDIPKEREPEDLRNPYLNSPPSPRFFNRHSNDGDEGNDHPSTFYALEISRSVERAKRQRSFSDQSQGGQLVPSRNIGSRPKQRGMCSFLGRLALFMYPSTKLCFVPYPPTKYPAHVQQRRDRCSCTATRLLSLLLTHIKYVPAFGFRRT